MVEFNTLSKDDQKIICELLGKQLKNQDFTDSDIGKIFHLMENSI